MKLTEKYKVNPEFEDLFSFKSEKEELEHEAKMIMFRILSSFEKMTDRPIQKKEIAEAISTSSSYVTQLFNGDKLINLTTLAKLVKLKPRFDFHRGMNSNAIFDLPVNEPNDGNTLAI